MVGLFVVVPLAATGSMQGRVVEYTFSLVIVFGAASATSDRKVGRVLLALAGVAVTLSLVTSGPLATLATLIYLVTQCLVLLKEVMLREGKVDHRRIQGAVAVYLLIGLAWSQAYFLVEQLAPGAFQATSTPDETALVYFSYVTLSTVGYGDVTPAHPFAYSLAVAEALVGQLYPAILIGRLVSLVPTRY
ncbi:MAG: potassium channel family protein [Candidatus Eremiobacterota bacterium]